MLQEQKHCNTTVVFWIAVALLKNSTALPITQSPAKLPTDCVSRPCSPFQCLTTCILLYTQSKLGSHSNHLIMGLKQNQFTGIPDLGQLPGWRQVLSWHSLCHFPSPFKAGLAYSSSSSSSSFNLHSMPTNFTHVANAKTIAVLSTQSSYALYKHPMAGCSVASALQLIYCARFCDNRAYYQTGKVGGALREINDCSFYSC